MGEEIKSLASNLVHDRSYKLSDELANEFVEELDFISIAGIFQDRDDGLDVEA